MSESASEIVPGVKLDSKWRRRGSTVLKLAALGGIFAGGALVVGELFGPKVARDIGQSGGLGFAQGLSGIHISGARGRGRRYL